MFFVTEDGGLTTAGYVLTAVAVFVLLIVISALANKNKKISAKQLAFAAVALALATVCSNIRLFRLPMGGALRCSPCCSSPSSDTGTVQQSGSWPVLLTACCR